MVPGASRQGTSDWGKVALHDLVASTALLLMLGLRSWLHKPMCDCITSSRRCYLHLHLPPGFRLAEVQLPSIKADVLLSP